MKTEDLKELGIEDEDLIKAIFALHGKSINKLQSEHTAALEEATALKVQLEEATKAINGFKELDVDGIKAASAEWENKAKQAQLEADEKVKTLKFDHALDDALRGAKVKNPKTIRPLLKQEELSLNDAGEIEGLTNQLDEIRGKDDYLFESEEEDAPRIVVGGNNRKVNTDSVVKSARDGAGLGQKFSDD